MAGSEPCKQTLAWQRGELPREFPIVTVFFLCIFLPVIISAPTASSLPATLSPDVSFKGELQSFV